MKASAIMWTGEPKTPKPYFNNGYWNQPRWWPTGHVVSLPGIGVRRVYTDTRSAEKRSVVKINKRFRTFWLESLTADYEPKEALK